MKRQVDLIKKALAQMGTDLSIYSIAISGSNVYLSGFGFNTQEESLIASVWKYDGRDTERIITHSSCDFFNALAVSGNHVCVAGWTEENGERFAGIWRAGDPIWEHGCVSQAKAIAISGQDVYVVGWEETQGHRVAKVWKNNETHYTLTDGISRAEATAIAISGYDVYVAGWEEIAGNPHPVVKVWRNGEPLYTLTNGNNCAMASAIAITNANVYVAGFEEQEGRVWTNGTSSSQIRISDSNIYESGMPWFCFARILNRCWVGRSNGQDAWTLYPNTIRER